MQNGLLRQHLYEWAFLILALKNVLDSSLLFHRPEWLDTLLILAFLSCIAWKLSQQTYTLARLAIYLLLGAIVVYTCAKSDYYYILFSFLGIIAIQDVELRRVVMKTAAVKAILIMVHVLYFLYAVLVYSDFTGILYNGEEARFFFYLGHPNTFAMFVLWTMLEFVYAYYERMNVLHLLLLCLLNTAMFLFTRSDTSLIVGTVALLLLLMDKLRKLRWGRALNLLSLYGFAVCAILFPGISIAYTQMSGASLAIFDFFDKLFTGRLLFGAFGYDQYGFTLLGRTLSFSGKVFWRGHWFDAIIFDNSYLWMFIRYGYLYLLLIAAALIRFGKSTTPLEKILVISFTLYGIMEAYIINVALCFPLLFIGRCLYSELEQKKPSTVRRMSRLTGAS